MIDHGNGHISSRTDVRNDPRIWDPKTPYVVVHAPTAEEYNEDVCQFRALFGPG